MWKYADRTFRDHCAKDVYDLKVYCEQTFDEVIGVVAVFIMENTPTIFAFNNPCMMSGTANFQTAILQKNHSGRLFCSIRASCLEDKMPSYVFKFNSHLHVETCCPCDNLPPIFIVLIRNRKIKCGYICSSFYKNLVGESCC